MNVDYADVHDVIFSDIRIEADEIIPRPQIQKTDADQYDDTPTDYMPRTIGVSVVWHPEYSAGGERRGRNRDMTFRNVHLYADRPPIVSMRGYDEAHKTENITVEGLYWNDQAVTSLEGECWNMGDFTDNIVLK